MFSPQRQWLCLLQFCKTRNQEKYKNRNQRRANSKGKKLFEMNKREQTVFAARGLRVKECEAKLWLVEVVRVKKRGRMLQR